MSAKGKSCSRAAAAEGQIQPVFLGSGFKAQHPAPE
jgi:hypothetical protein